MVNKIGDDIINSLEFRTKSKRKIAATKNESWKNKIKQQKKKKWIVSQKNDKYKADGDKISQSHFSN